MYYKIITDLVDKMRVYKETPLDVEHPAYGIDIKEIRTPWERDYFTIENGNIKLISGRPDKTEFDGVKVEYPKGTKEICLFVEKNKDSLLPMNEELPPRPSLLRATWPRSSLASGPAGARGPLSLLRACAQPSRGPERPSCPAPARCPKPPGATSAVNQELVRPAPPLRPPEAPLAPTPPSKHRTFRREQTSDVQAHGQTHRHSQAPTPRETAGRRKRGSQGHSHSTRGRPGVRRDRDRKR